MIKRRRHPLLPHESFRVAGKLRLAVNEMNKQIGAEIISLKIRKVSTL